MNDPEEIRIQYNDEMPRGAKIKVIASVAVAATR